MAFRETISDALWMSVLAGLGGVIIEAILLGGFYLFDPVAKMTLEEHGAMVVLSFLVIFVGAFGLSLQIALEGQFWRGKWK